MGLCQGSPAPLPQPTVNQHPVSPACWGGVGKPLCHAGNSLAGEPQLCISPIFQGCPDLSLITFQQLDTISLLGTENDLEGNKQ